MLYHALEMSSKKYPNKSAVIGEHRALTFSELLRQVGQVARYFQTLRLGPGDHLVVGIPPSPEFYVVFFAASALGIKTIPVSPSGKLPSQVKALEPITLAGAKEFIEAVERSGVRPRRIVPWDRKEGLLITPSTGRFVRGKMVRQEAVLGTSSSGTTGEPAIFLRSAESLFRRARLGGIAWGIKAKDIMLSTGPFTSGVNVNYHLILPVVLGATVVVLEKFHWRKVVETTPREQVTVLFAVPLIFDLLARLPSSYHPDFSSLRLCISGGTHLADAIADRFYQRFNIRIGQGYGGVHFAPAFTVNGGRTPGAVGRKDSVFPVRIVDDRGKATGAGKIGEIAFDTYKIKNRWARLALSRNPNRRGRYVYTGDLGRFDERGNLFVVGRKSALIKVGANSVIAAEVEDALRSHPRVQDAVVFPLRTGQTDEAVGAVVVRNGRVTREELIDHCSQRLDPYKCPRSISFRKSLPRNPHGKIIRYLYEPSPAPTQT
jgi:long-chain acyl-CoA synthetase